MDGMTLTDLEKKYQSKFIKIPMLCFRIHHVNGIRITLAEYKVLELVVSYMKNGLKMQTIEIAFVIGIAGTTVSTMLTKLENLELITIDNRNKGTGAGCERRVIFPTEKLLDLCRIEPPPHLSGSQGSPLRRSQESPLRKAKGTLKRALSVHKTNENYRKPNEKDFECSNKLLAASFDSFWERYPKKRGRKEALAEWKKLKPDEALVDVVLVAIEKQKLWREQGEARGEFRPEWKDPCRWLKNESWTDEVEVDEWNPPLSPAEVCKIMGYPPEAAHTIIR